MCTVYMALACNHGRGAMMLMQGCWIRKYSWESSLLNGAYTLQCSKTKGYSSWELWVPRSGKRLGQKC